MRRAHFASALQHVAMVKDLLRLGMSPADIHCVDVPYTAHAAIVRGLLDSGIPTSNINIHDYRLAHNYQCDCLLHVFVVNKVILRLVCSPAANSRRCAWLRRCKNCAAVPRPALSWTTAAIFWRQGHMYAPCIEFVHDVCFACAGV